MRNSKLIRFGKLLLVCVLCSSCMHEWLDTKPDRQLVVPTDIEDFQAIMDNSVYMNYITTPSLLEISADDFFVTSEQWNSQSKTHSKNAYIWKKDIFEGNGDNSWNTPYRRIYYANVALEGVDRIDKTAENTDEWNNVKGSALFFRAISYSHLVELFTRPYNEDIADVALGLPLKMESDIDISPRRSTLRETYELIVNDLKKAALLLPIEPFIKTRPSRTATYGLLARVYLQMGNFSSALNYADSCIRYSDGLLNFEDLDSKISYPFPKYNDEVIFHESMIAESMLMTVANIDSVLYSSYNEGDLRKTLFFGDNGETVSFRGSYDGDRFLFTGLSVNEMFLIKAECAARLGNTDMAIQTLERLLQSRYVDSAFKLETGLQGLPLLKLILLERRKELVFRGLRWGDLRRLNQAEETQTRLTRVINGNVYRLEPNDKRYTLPIPDDVIQISGIVQNER